MTVILILVAILAALVLLAAYYCYRKAFRAIPERQTEAYPIPKGSIYAPYRDVLVEWIKAARAMPHDQISIRSFDGLTLWGKYYEYAPGAPVEILFHGYRGNAEREMSGAIGRCHRLGHSALIVDQRTCGKSEGKVITFGIYESRDCLSWIDYAIDRFGPNCRIILAGVSMGAATVVTAAGRGLPKNVIGILADCGYTSARDIIKKVIATDMKLPPDLAFPFVRLGARLFGRFDVDERSPLEAVRNTPVPILFIHGEADGFVPCEMSRRCHEANPDVTRLYTVPGAAHALSYLVDGEGYIQAAGEFFSTLS